MLGIREAGAVEKERVIANERRKGILRGYENDVSWFKEKNRRCEC